MRNYPRGCHAVQLPYGEVRKTSQPMGFYGVVWQLKSSSKDYTNDLFAIRPRGCKKWTVFYGEKALWGHSDLDVVRMRAALTEGLR